MKKMMTLMVLVCMTITLSAQNNNNDPSPNEIYSLVNGYSESAQKEKIKLERAAKAEANKNAIYAAGTALKASANWQWIALGSAAVGGATLAVGSDKGEDALKVVGFTCVGVALVSQVVSVVKKYKAGKQLQIGAGKITYTF